ncbi:MAG: tetratricopeptide repeat protein, partial [Opitutaceae bacterium]
MNPGPRAHALAAFAIVAAALAAYANSFRAPFIFDDIASIVDNPTIRRLWPPGDALSPPKDFGFTVSGRPLLNLSFAINYAIGGLNVWSYHALNLLIHTLAGLTLFGLVRRTLVRSQLSALSSQLSFATALLWTLHPLQTESVTYTVQRAESLMGLFFLATLYGFVRSLDSAHPRRWQIFSVVACLLGVATKEVIALAPILVFLYDRTFVSGTLRAAWQRHRWHHLALFATWIPLAFLLVSTGGNRGGTMGFGLGISWSGYWLTQFEAVYRYLQLSLWPHPLVFDYGKISATALAALPFALPVLALVALTLLALWRWPVAGFLGAWFFALLAPTSIMPGTLQMIVEHRMYLPLAAVVAAAFALAARYLSPRALLALATALALAAGLATAQRNALYRDEKSLWQQALVHRPANARAHNNLGLILYRENQLAPALAHFRESLRLDPTVAQTHFNLGLALMKSGRTNEAVAPLQEAVRILPYFFTAHLNLGLVLTQLGRAPEALDHLATAVRYDPTPAEAHF